MSGPVKKPEQTALYRIWGDDDLLLYIGVSKDFGARWKQHAKQQPWWDEMRRLTADELFSSRAEAEAAEKAAIKAERPKYNKTHLVPVQRGPRTAPAPARPAAIPVRIPSWEGAPVHPIDEFMKPGFSMTEMVLSDPATVESILARLPEDRRELARMRIEYWRKNYEVCQTMREYLKDLYVLERQFPDKPELLAMIRKAKIAAREILEMPCPSCNGEPPSGMACQECGDSSPIRWPDLRPLPGLRLRRTRGAA